MRYLIIISTILFPFFVIIDWSQNKDVQSQNISDPDTLYYNTLKRLDLSQSDLKELPGDITLFKNIDELDLSNNPIEKLDASILKLKKLKTIKLNNCPNIDIENVISVIKDLSIETLEIKNCILTYLPSSISECKSLKKLDVKENHIERFPEELAMFGRLNWLDISNNNIDSLPEDFDAMMWLKHLDLSYNPCLSIQHNYKIIGGLRNLETLTLNGAEEITSDISNLYNLKELNLNNSNIKEMPSPFNLPHLKSLLLSNANQLNYEVFFKSLSGMDSIENLELSSPKLNKLGDEIHKLSNLTSLKIGENSLKDFPDLEKFEKLSKIKIQLNSQSQAINVFEAISKCKKIQTLDISFSELDIIPSSLSKLNNLRSLNMEGINLQKFPSSLIDLKELQELNIKGNNFEPDKIDELTERLIKCDVIVDRSYSVPENFQEQLASTRESYTLNPANSNTITTIDGSLMRIPANAFVDKNGTLPKNDVVISFQPYYTSADIYLSGINMNYDSGGVTHSFISAGMFNVSAKSGENELVLNKQKRILMDFKSNDPQTNYNYYSYNTTTRNWNYKGKDNIKPKKKEDSVVKVLGVNTKQKRLKKMCKPRMKSYYFNQNSTEVHYIQVESKGRRKYQFWINRGYKDNEIKDEIPIYFQKSNGWVYESDTTQRNFFVLKREHGKIFNQLTYHVRFQKDHHYLSSQFRGSMEIDVYPDRENDRFNIVFKFKNDSLILTGYPEYNEAAKKTQNQTRKDYEEYLLTKEKRKKQEADLMAKYKAELLVYEAKMKEYRDYLRKQNAEELSQINNKPVNGDRILRTLQLDQLGTWNCDIINRLPNGIEIFVRLYDKGTRINPTSLTVIDKTNNGFGSFGSSKIIVDCYVNTILMVKIDKNKYGYAKFSINDNKIKNLDLTLNILETNKMTMKEFSDQVFN